MSQPQTPLERAVARARTQPAPPPRAGAPSPLAPLPAADGPATMPDGIARFSWAALFGGPIWAVTFKVWWGLGSLLPFVGIPILFILAFRGREAAWHAGSWQTLEAFEAAQKRWLYWSTMLSVALLIVLGVAAYFLIAPMLDDLQELEQVMELPEG